MIISLLRRLQSRSSKHWRPGVYVPRPHRSLGRCRAPPMEWRRSC
jgi:hypothetical protein